MPEAHDARAICQCFTAAQITGSHDRTIKVWDLSKNYCTVELCDQLPSFSDLLTSCEPWICHRWGRRHADHLFVLELQRSLLAGRRRVRSRSLSTFRFVTALEVWFAPFRSPHRQHERGDGPLGQPRPFLGYALRRLRQRAHGHPLGSDHLAQRGAQYGAFDFAVRV